MGVDTFEGGLVEVHDLHREVGDVLEQVLAHCERELHSSLSAHLDQLFDVADFQFEIVDDRHVLVFYLLDMNTMLQLPLLIQLIFVGPPLPEPENSLQQILLVVDKGLSRVLEVMIESYSVGLGGGGGLALPGGHDLVLQVDLLPEDLRDIPNHLHGGFLTLFEGPKLGLQPINLLVERLKALRVELADGVVLMVRRGGVLAA